MRKEICRPAEKIRKLVKKCLHSNRFYDIVIKLAVRQRKWSIGQAVKTPPSHGGNRGSIPLSTALEPLNFSSRVLLRYMEILRGGTPAGARQMKKVRADKKGGR